MAFDGLVMANICYELKTSLVNGRIAKIAMPNKDELLISIKNNSKTFRLLISANASKVPSKLLPFVCFLENI